MQPLMRSKFVFYTGIFVGMLIALAGIYFAGKCIKQKWIVHKTLTSPHWQERYAQMKQLPAGKYSVVFLGNSLTELFSLDQYFVDSAYLNAGIVGDFTEGLLQRVDEITALKPKKIFIEIGINDIIEQVPVDEIGSNYEELVRRIKIQSPQSEIYIQSNLPVVIRHPGLFAGTAEVNKKVVELNGRLRQLAWRQDVHFVDLHACFRRSGNVEDLLIPDGIHLTHKAYGVWKLAIIPYLEN
jgi:lysophospholipase L1-like esterase